MTSATKKDKGVSTINKILITALLVGTLLMLGVMLLCRKWYALSIVKTALFAPVLAVCGFVSVKIMAFVETGKWSGLSFFGAVLLLPLLLIIIGKLLKVPYGIVADIAAPSVSIMLALMKVQCLMTGCCKGIVLRETADGVMRFPSQIIEMLAALALMCVLLFFMKQQKKRGVVYPWFMVLYGITRFILNLFRETTPFIWILPAGNFWALISVAIGIIWIKRAEIHHGYE